ncbi:MAG TPA: Rid family hydrolase [Candidatus Sulfotelmatobacter sp.]|nr:Rid family hydrolase [Candidatus Sulfotelmatobacter sp.]
MPRWPFSDAVRAGDTVYVAGRLGLDPRTRKPHADVREEAKQILDDIRAVLALDGLTMDALVMVTIYAPDVSHFAAFNEVYLTYFSDDLPARAFLGSGPLLYGCRFEVTAIAVG